ncbi:hypothetical protein HYU20_01460, partial [Candidatus Woesearchaeota archaeon]|nr:hypothetical protein [Candidatus Woesearchaeota archaeon]
MNNEPASERKSSAAEIAILAVVFALMLYLGAGTASQHRLSHDSPVGYSASDSFQHLARAQSIKDMGQYRMEAPYIVAGLDDVVGFYPPIIYHLTALLSNAAGLQTHDALMLLMGVAIALGGLLSYYLARSLGKPVALLAIPLILFMATGKSFLGIVTFGQMPFFLSALFLLGTGWAMSNAGLPRSAVLIAIFLTGTAMTHTSETIFLAMLIGLIFLFASVKWLPKQKIDGIKAIAAENRQLILGLMLAAIATLYFWPMFIGIWLKALPYRFTVETTSASFPAATVFPTDYGFMLIAVLLGIAAAALLMIQKRQELGNVLHSKLFPLFFSLFMLIAGFGTYVGFGLRSFQLRLAWPLLLAPLAAFGAYQLIKIALLPFLKNMLRDSTLPIFYAAVATIISVVVIASYYEPPSSGGIGADRWNAMMWIADSTPANSTVYVLYSHAFSQTSTLYSTERMTYFLELPNFASIINQVVANGTFNRMTPVTIPSDSGPNFPYRTGAFSFGRHIATTKTSDVIDICSANYYLIDKALGDQTLTQANLYLLQQFAN